MPNVVMAVCANDEPQGLLCRIVRDGFLLFEGPTDWLALDDMIRHFNVTRCLVDSQPELRPAREFVGRFAGGYMAAFNAHQDEAIRMDGSFVFINRSKFPADYSKLKLLTTVAART